MAARQTITVTKTVTRRPKKQTPKKPIKKKG